MQTNEIKGITDSSAPDVSEFFEGSPVPTFAIDNNHIVTHWNRACELISGLKASDMVGTSNHWRLLYPQQRPLLVDLIIEGTIQERIDTYYRGKQHLNIAIEGTYQIVDFFPHLGESGRWLSFSAAPLHNPAGQIVGAIEVLQDITDQKAAEIELQKAHAGLEQLVAKRTEQLAQANSRLEIDIQQREKAEAELLRRNSELTELNSKLSAAQEQLVQSEKLASIGQLAAGVAHEINNPIGYIFSNFGTLEKYIADLLSMLSAYETAEKNVAADVAGGLKTMREQVDLEFLKEDIPVLMRESKEGIVRVRKIVQDLKDFSRVDAKQEWQWADLHQGIDSTLNIVSNEVKYKADVIKEYGDLPEVECLSSQVYQVIMNLIVNAAHAMGATRGKIRIRTGVAGDDVWIEVADNGSGIPKENLSRIFDPFFTTKPIGQGTGLGLSLSYGIVQKHHGKIDVRSEIGKGTSFRVTLPIRQTTPIDKERTNG